MINWILALAPNSFFFFPPSHFFIYYLVVTIHTLLMLRVGHMGFDKWNELLAGDNDRLDGIIYFYRG